MKEHPYTTIVFDLDGTLLDTWPALLGAITACGGAPTPDDTATLLRPAMSQGIDAVLQQATTTMGLDTQQAQDTHARMRQAYFQDGPAHTHAYPGIDAMLHVLQKRQFRLALCTNRDRTSTQALLRHVGWTHLFAHMVCLHECAHPKPHALPLLTVLAQLGCAPQQALFVGDSEIDARCASHANVDFCAHMRGYHHDATALQPCVLTYDLAPELTHWLIQDQPHPVSQQEMHHG